MVPHSSSESVEDAFSSVVVNAIANDQIEVIFKIADISTKNWDF